MSEKYRYKVRDRTGALLEGELDADNVSAVATRLRKEGYIPIEIDRTAGTGFKTDLRIPGITDRIKLRDLAVFSRQLSTMVHAGLPLIRALGILTEQTESRQLAKIVADIRDDIEAGSSLSASMAKHPKAFDSLYVSMVKAGETGGVLDDVLLRVADTIEKQVALRQKVKSAMTYPIMALSLITVITAAMLIFIVPMFEELYNSLGGTLPLPTRILLMVSKFIAGWGGLVILVVVIGGIVFIVRWNRTENGKRTMDKVKLRIPILGGIAHKASLARFARTLSVLLRSGVPLLESLDIVGETVNNAVVSDAVADVKEGVRGGESLVAPLAHHSVFPPMVVQMMAVGEDTGALDTMLDKIAEFYEGEVEALVEGLTSLIEPLLILVMGIAVGGMLIALYMPMFNIINMIR